MNPHHFKSLRRETGLTVRDLADLLLMNEKTIRVWERASGQDPHPTAVRVLEWIRDGLIALPVPAFERMTAAEFQAGRISLGLSIERLAGILDVAPPEIIAAWESDRGPHPAATFVMQLMLTGYRPPESLD